LFSEGGERNIDGQIDAHHEPTRCGSVTKMERFAMKLSRAAMLAALLLGAAPAAAQNSTAPTPAAPAPKVEPAPAPATPTGNVVQPAQPAAPVEPTPAPQQPPMQAMPIQPDQAYPNGFQDPNDPFANEMRAYREEQQGFPWGLLGLLGLLGLIPLVRGNGAVRTVYVEREEPRRVVRERVEEDQP
jgi:hypothetical protein